MTLVAHQILLEIRDGQARQLSYREIDRIMDGMYKMFGEVEQTPEIFQDYLDRYCQRKGIKPLIITDIYI